MSIYTSFLVRCWLKRDHGSAEAAYLVEQVQTGAQLRSHSLAEVCDWVAAINAKTVENPPPSQPEEA
jgi:ATP phosphoribosyltransferase